MAFGLRYKTTSTILSVRGRPCETTTKDKLIIENNARQNLQGMANAAAYKSTGTLGLGVVGGVGQRSQDKAGSSLRRLLGYIHLAVAHRRWGPRAGEGCVCALLLISGLKKRMQILPLQSYPQMSILKITLTSTGTLLARATVWIRIIFFLRIRIQLLSGN